MQRNEAAVDEALAHLHEIRASDAPASVGEEIGLVPATAPAFVRETIVPMLLGTATRFL